MGWMLALPGSASLMSRRVLGQLREVLVEALVPDAVVQLEHVLAVPEAQEPSQVPVLAGFDAEHLHHLGCHVLGDVIVIGVVPDAVDRLSSSMGHPIMPSMPDVMSG